MIISDISVRRPVFASVISMLLVILGLASMMNLPVRQYPDTDSPIVSISTRYSGASAEVIETKVTQVIEDRIAGIEGIVKLTSTSSDERSNIRVEFSLSRDIEAAANDIRDRVSRVLDQLPDEADPPEIAKSDSSSQAVMYLDLASDRMTGLELTDYADRYLVDRFSTVPGVAQVRISGARRFAMRIWLNRDALAARALTVMDIESALRTENVELPAGRLESKTREFTLRTDTGFNTEDDFKRLVIGRGADGQPVRLGEVANVRIGAENDRSVARSNGTTSVSLGMEQLSKANSVLVSKEVRKEVAVLTPELPEGMRLEVSYDRAEFIEESMNEVYKALAISIALVLIIIYLFLGSFIATLIPAVVVPVSLVSTFIVMAAMGYTINILTLLGLVLAIGLVVDDAIVVLENIFRRIEAGQKPILAAIDGTNEIGFAVIATTLVLVAVFVPMSFIQGDIGRLFREFGITLAAAVLFSSLIALTLTPMLSSKLLKGGNLRRGPVVVIDRFFKALSNNYKYLLEKIIKVPWLVMAAVVLVSLVTVYQLRALPSEYAPKEDRGVFFISLRAPEGSTMEYTNQGTVKLEKILATRTGDDQPIKRYLTRLPGGWGRAAVNSAILIVHLEHWDNRDVSDRQLATWVSKEADNIPEAQIFARTPSALGLGGGDSPVELVLGGPDYDQLKEWRDKMLVVMEAMPELVQVDSDFQETKPQMRVSVDRDRAATLGVSLQAVGRTLETMLGSRNVTTYVDRGREYNVILMGEDKSRASPDDLTNLYVRSSLTNELVPLSNLVKITEQSGPSDLRRHDRMRSITMSAGLAQGVRLGEAIDRLLEVATETLPASARLTWDGESKEFLESGSSLYLTFGMALLIVFLVLSAQFESFVNPLIIMVTVPLALMGAVLGLWMYAGTINVFSQIGVILLVGLSAKNGVLIVEFANQLRDRGNDLRVAVVEAAAVRLRPILMTSAATTFGAMPLLLASGAGAESRQPIGIVVVFGVTISALLTLFVVPALYVLFAKHTRSPQHMSQMIDKLRSTIVKEVAVAATTDTTETTEPGETSEEHS